MKIGPVRAELFHADIQTDGHDEANSRFSHFCGSAKSDSPSENSYMLPTTF